MMCIDCKSKIHVQFNANAHTRLILANIRLYPNILEAIQSPENFSPIHVPHIICQFRMSRLNISSYHRTFKMSTWKYNINNLYAMLHIYIHSQIATISSRSTNYIGVNLEHVCGICCVHIWCWRCVYWDTTKKEHF